MFSIKSSDSAKETTISRKQILIVSAGAFVVMLLMLISYQMGARDEDETPDGPGMFTDDWPDAADGLDTPQGPQTPGNNGAEWRDRNTAPPAATAAPLFGGNDNGPAGTAAPIFRGNDNGPAGTAAPIFRGNDNGPASAAAPLPRFLKAGTRITYHEGQSVVHGVGSHLVPNAEGQWVNPKTGQRYDERANRNSGGVGYLTLDVVHAEPQLIAAVGRASMLVDNEQATTTSFSGLVGNAEALGHYWTHPARLGQIREGRGPGEQINRVRYDLNGRTYNAISIVRSTENSYESLIHDLETGLLLASSRSNTGDPVQVAGTGPNAESARGAVVISHSRFVGMRELKLPWSAEPPPPWAAPGRRLDYQGGYRSVLQGGTGLPPLGMAMSILFDRANNGCVLGRVTSRNEIGSGLPPQENTINRCFATAMLAGVWVPPGALRGLRPSQVIDEDAIIRLRTTYGGVDGGVAVFTEQGPLEITHRGYDLQTGMLVSVRSLRQQGAGQIEIQLQLTGR